MNFIKFTDSCFVPFSDQLDKAMKEGFKYKTEFSKISFFWCIKFLWLFENYCVVGNAS